MNTEQNPTDLKIEGGVIPGTTQEVVNSGTPTLEETIAAIMDARPGLSYEDAQELAKIGLGID